MSYLDVLKIIIEITEQKYFLLYGTLLGCIRDKQFIPWDNDMDIGILEEDLKEEYIEEFKKHFNVSIYKHNNKASKIRLFHGQQHTCFDILRKEGENRHFNDFGNNEIEMMIPGEFLKEFKLVDFYDIKVRVPKNAEEFLVWNYGDWKTPTKDYSWATSPGRIK